MLEYDFYFLYGGKVPEEDFSKYKMRAKSIIDYYTFSRAKEGNEKVKIAMCELIDLENQIEISNEKDIASEKVGSYSVTYKDKQLSNEAIESKRKEILFRHLGHTGLLYRGI